MLVVLGALAVGNLNILHAAVLWLVDLQILRFCDRPTLGFAGPACDSAGNLRMQASELFPVPITFKVLENGLDNTLWDTFDFVYCNQVSPFACLEDTPMLLSSTYVPQLESDPQHQPGSDISLLYVPPCKRPSCSLPCLQGCMGYVVVTVNTGILWEGYCCHEGHYGPVTSCDPALAIGSALSS